MKLLYVSSFHGALEYDELSLFSELGIDWFSTGLYLNPENPSLEHAPRKPINKKAQLDLINYFLSFNPNYKIYDVPILKKDFVDQFDIVLVSHCCPTQLAPLQRNWDVIKHKPVIWRTYTQQSSALEAAIQRYRNEGLKLVRISPRERTIPYYAGDDAIIRGHLDENEYYGWTGEDQTVLTFNNFFMKRHIHSNTDIYLRIKHQMAPINFELYGCNNEDAPMCLGELSWEQVKEKYRKSRVYFALGSKPASLTYNLLEAMLTGAPVVTWGPELGNLRQIRDWANTYEVPEIIVNGENGFCFDNEKEIKAHIRLLLHDDKLANKISINARKTIIAMFSKEKIKNDWAAFLNDLL